MASWMKCGECGGWPVKVPDWCDSLGLSDWFCMRCRGQTLVDLVRQTPQPQPQPLESPRSTPDTD